MINQVIQLLALVPSVVFHEVAHGHAADRMGDPTARMSGRLSANPISHIDPVGSLLVPLILVITHSPFIIGWAKPVPFNPSFFHNPKRGIQIVGAAGPLANLLLAVLGGILLHLFPADNIFGLFFINLCFVNVFLALFNLIPIPPLDGSRIVMGFLPHKLLSSYMQLERYGIYIILLLLYLNALDWLIQPLAGIILHFLLPNSILPG
jgi:Zn-dependent protease